VESRELGEAWDAERLFLHELAAIERTIQFACRRGGLRDNADDFSSYVKLKLIENDYAVIRKHDRRSSFAAFISIVVQRLLLDYRVREWGKWHASAHARRLGEAAIAVEAMLHRDGRTIDEALPALLRRWPELTRCQVEEIARTLPAHSRRPRPVDLDHAAEAIGSDATSVAEAAFEADRLQLSRKIAELVRSFMALLDEHDRLIFRFRFEAGLSVAEISRVRHIEQKPLYRQIDRMLLALRGQLEKAGIHAEDVEEILASRNTDLDFGFYSPSSESPSYPAMEEEIP
jgi:RNA polymerase sigma factor for flagellar operon FliA